MTVSSELAVRLARAGLDPAYVERVVTDAVTEDLAGGVDVTSAATVPAEQVATVDLVARAEGVVAGLCVAETAFEVVSRGTSVAVSLRADGDRVSRGDVLLTVTAPTRALLTAERTALNFLCHLSGIATLTRRWVDAIEGTSARIRDTRKTTPGLRALEKYAVRCGGGVNHRMSLSDVALVKDNHVLAAGGVVEAFDSVRRLWPGHPIEVEVDGLAQLEAVLDAGADLVLLDNFEVESMRKAVEVASGRARLEASGGLTLDGARAVAATGVDFLAVGALTHSAPVLDIAADMRPVVGADDAMGDVGGEG